MSNAYPPMKKQVLAKTEVVNSSVATFIVYGCDCVFKGAACKFSFWLLSSLQPGLATTSQNSYKTDRQENNKVSHFQIVGINKWNSVIRQRRLLYIVCQNKISILTVAVGLAGQGLIVVINVITQIMSSETRITSLDYVYFSCRK